jgi:hypothetical protein
LSHAPSASFAWLFFSLLCFCLAGLGPWFSYRCFPRCLDYRLLDYPACWLTWSFAQFLQGLALNFSPPNLYLPSSWDYRYEPQCLFRFLVQNAQWS